MKRDGKLLSPVGGAMPCTNTTGGVVDELASQIFKAAQKQHIKI